MVAILIACLVPFRSNKFIYFLLHTGICYFYVATELYILLNVHEKQNHSFIKCYDKVWVIVIVIPIRVVIIYLVQKISNSTSSS